MPIYKAPLRDQQFVMHEVLGSVDTLKALPRYADLDIEAKGVKILLLTPEDAVQFDKPYQQLREEFLLNR